MQKEYSALQHWQQPPFLPIWYFRKKAEGAARPVAAWRRWRPVRWFSRSLRIKWPAGSGISAGPGFFIPALRISLLLLLGQILSYWFVMLAYGLKLSFWHGAAVFLIVHIGTIIPGAPIQYRDLPVLYRCGFDAIRNRQDSGDQFFHCRVFYSHDPSLGRRHAGFRPSRVEPEKGANGNYGAG